MADVFGVDEETIWRQETLERTVKKRAHRGLLSLLAPCGRPRPRSRVASPRYSQASAFSRDAYGDGSSYRAAYTPGSQGSGANGAYARQTAASQYSRNNPSYSAARKKAGRGKKIALGVIIAILVVAVGGGSASPCGRTPSTRADQGKQSDEEIMAINDALKPEKDMTFTEPLLHDPHRHRRGRGQHRGHASFRHEHRGAHRSCKEPGHDGIHPPAIRRSTSTATGRTSSTPLTLTAALPEPSAKRISCWASRYRTTRK